MVITITPVSPSACLPGDKGQLQESLSSLCLLWLLQPLWTDASHLQTTFSNYSFSNLLHFHLCPQNKKKKPNKQEKPNWGRSTRFSLCSVKHSFREAYQPRQKRVTFPKQRNQMKATARWRKGNSFTQQLAKSISNALPLRCSVLQPSPERGAERESDQSPLHETALKNTDKPWDEQGAGAKGWKNLWNKQSKTLRKTGANQILGNLTQQLK